MKIFKYLYSIIYNLLPVGSWSSPKSNKIFNPKMKILKREYQKIRETIGAYPAETGGLLIGNRSDGTIKEFVFDSNGKTSGAAYSPDTKFCNTIIKNARKNGMDFLGMIHSHPRGYTSLSGEYGDIGYIKDIFSAMPSLDKILVPIIQSASSGKFEFIPYVVYRDKPNLPVKCDLEIIEMQPEEIIYDNNTGLKDISRLEGAIDIDTMRDEHFTFVGCGGAGEIIIDLVRSGVTNFTIIDFDTVSHSNLTTQGFTKYHAENKISKVSAIKNYALSINPSVQIETLEADFTKLSKDKLVLIAQKTTFWMFMCDQFEPHKLGQELLEKYPAKAIFAGMYWKSLACEIVYYIPEGKGKTPATYKSIHQKGRYEYFAKGGNVPKTLIGTTIFHSHYLNNVIGLLCLAMIHNDHNSEDFIMGDWFDDLSNHNLIQFRLNPRWSNQEGNLFSRTYPVAENTNHGGKVFEAIWRYVPPISECA